MTQTTAVRKTKGAKTFVEVTFADGTVATLGGKRAERANAVIVITGENGTGAYGLRADVAKAEQEAHRLTQPKTRSWRGTFFDGVEQLSLSYNDVLEAKANGVEVTHKKVVRTYQTGITEAAAIRVQEVAA
jgi:hypothetical protein